MQPTSLLSASIGRDGKKPLHQAITTKRAVAFLLSIVVVTLVRCDPSDERAALSEAMDYSIRYELLEPWYPNAVDSIDGGFLSSFTFDFQPTGEQDKMIVTQARHVWTNSKAGERYPDVSYFLPSARHGFHFLRDKMWDAEYGGFYTLVDKKGNPKPSADQIKTAYGNAFGIYALAAYYQASGDTSALQLAKETFLWLEKHSHDSLHLGYFQHLTREGAPIARPDTVESTSELGYKDQNSSIHLLEAFTELYQVWPDSLLRERLQEMLVLIRDTIVKPEGYMTLFFRPDWTPVSFRDSTRKVIEDHHWLDHVSFGHDVEIAYLMLEASHILGIKDDQKTLTVAKKLIDHALRKGWDNEAGGFYDEGYYFKDTTDITITADTKNWWAQAEGLNTLLIMADLFPEDDLHYYEKFKTQWNFINANLIDHEHGDWYAGSIDRQPEMKTAQKGHLWKAAYHQYRALSNCARELKTSD